MSFLRSLIGPFVALSIGAGVIAPAVAAPALIQTMPGTWVCNSNGSNGPRSTTYTFRSVDPNTVAYNFVGRLNPNRKGAGVWRYDTKKGLYAFMGAGPMGWGVSIAKASPRATTLNLVDTYPDDPTNGTLTYRFSDNSATTVRHWRQNGKAMSQTGRCTKS